MAKNPLIRIRFGTANNPPFAAGDVLVVYWDDSALTQSTTLNAVTLVNPSYFITLGQPFTKDANDNVTTEYKVEFLDSNLYNTGGLELNYVKPIPTTPNQDDTHVGQPVLPPLPPPDPPPSTAVIPAGGSQVTNPNITNTPVSNGRPSDLKFN